MSETPKRVEKPWGYELWWARTDRYVGKILHLRQGETPGTLHRMTGIEDCDILEVSTPELEDVVRLEDRYGRAGTSKP
jgi:mannose-6-phosphate isomerase